MRFFEIDRKDDILASSKTHVLLCHYLQQLPEVVLVGSSLSFSHCLQLCEEERIEHECIIVYLLVRL